MREPSMLGKVWKAKVLKDLKPKTVLAKSN
jgi:hypothetical protein